MIARESRLAVVVRADQGNGDIHIIGSGGHVKESHIIYIYIIVTVWRMYYRCHNTT